MSVAMVSVLMPVYNCAHFLKQAINSILNQTYNDIEFIIIDDGSTDESEKIIKSYSDKRIHYYYQSNAGVANALNYGVKLATGKYIWRHDADDTSLPDKLEKQVSFLETNSTFALCSTQVAFMTESGKIAWKYRQPPDSYFNGLAFKEVTREQFNPYSPITHATVLIKLDVMKNSGGYRTAFKSAEDVDLWLRLLQKGYRAAVLNECNYFVRLSKSSSTQKLGWKNEFFRNLAFTFYEQRCRGEEDDLKKGVPVVIPPEPAITNLKAPEGKKFRDDLLSYFYPLHLNAKDWKASRQIIKYSVRDGWRLGKTWKSIIFPLLGKRLVNAGVKIRRLFK